MENFFLEITRRLMQVVGTLNQHFSMSDPRYTTWLYCIKQPQVALVIFKKQAWKIASIVFTTFLYHRQLRKTRLFCKVHGVAVMSTRPTQIFYVERM